MATPVQGPRSRVPSSEREAEVVVDAALHDGPEGLRLAHRSSACRARHRSSQRNVRSIPSRARSCGAWPGTTWSKAMAMSAPRARWISIARSGVSLRVVPSMWLWKVTPSSSMRRRPSSEKTWNPPESVSIGRSQVVKRWRPPIGSHHVLARADVQVIGVAEDDLRAGAADVGGTEAADDAMGAHRHEGGRADGAVRKREGSRASGAEGAVEGEVAHRTDRSHVFPCSECDRSAAGAPGRAHPSA